MTVVSPARKNDAGFRFPTPTDEDLPTLARLAHTVSATECGICRNYHVTWPYLRAVGANGSGPERAWSEERALLARLAAGRRDVRWLIAGSADAGLLALVRASSLKTEGASRHSITVIDQCNTPLTLCRAYADSVGMQVETIKQDLLGFTPEAPFDIVLMHLVIMFVDADRRAELMRRTLRWLAPRGWLVAVVTHVVPGAAPTRGAEDKEAWRQRAIEEAAASGEIDLPEDAETFIARLRGRREIRRERKSGAPWSLSDYTTMMQQAGFSAIQTIDLPYTDEELAAIGPGQRPQTIIVAAAAPVLTESAGGNQIPMDSLRRS